MFRVVGHAEMTEAGDDRVEPAVLPVAGEPGEVVMEHVVEGVVRRVQLVDQIAAFDEDAGVLRIGVNDVEGAGRRLRERRQHVVAAGVILRLELDVVLRLECFDHVGLGQPVP